MHASQDVRVLRCFDGLHYSFAMLELVHSELHESCSRISENPEALVGALWRCWSFVDLVHRIREITQAVPGLSLKTPQLVAFLDATKLAEEYRHYIQHLRGELSRKPITTSPVWGSLSWVAPNDPTCAHLAIFGAQIPGTSFETCVYDRQERHWVSRVTLGTSAGAFIFDPVYRVCQSFKEFILPMVRSTYKGDVEVRETPVIVFTSIANSL